MVRTLSDLRTAAKERADMVVGSFVTDDEWTRYINASAAWLYGILVTKFEDYNVSTATITTDGINDRFALPLDFLKLRGVDLQAPGTPSGWVSLKPFQFAERNRAAVPWPSMYLTLAQHVRYRLNGLNLWLTPKPPGGQQVRLHYTPQILDMEDDADALDGVNGWEQLVVLDAARKALVKEESDTSSVEREIAVLVKRIEDESQNRDAGEPPTVADVQRGGLDFVDDLTWWPR